jgi:hypothetical protein
MRIEIDTDTKDDKGEPIFEPVKGLSISRSLAIPKQLEFQQFFIEGFDEMARSSGRMTGQMWFFIVPDGLAQDVIINMIDTQDRVQGKPATIGLVLNPFSAHFEVHDSFQK